MSKDYAVLARCVVEGVGGPDNISKVFHCATRLRFQLLIRARSMLMRWEAFRVLWVPSRALVACK